jgi:hypothetical protein
MARNQRGAAPVAAPRPTEPGALELADNLMVGGTTNGAHARRAPAEVLAGIVDVLGRLRDQVSDVTGDAPSREAILKELGALEEITRRAHARISGLSEGAGGAG